MKKCSIHQGHAIKLIDMMAQEKLIKQGWGSHIQSFIALYNELAEQDDFSDTAMEQAVLRALRNHMERQLEGFAAFASMGKPDEELRKFEDDLHGMIEQIDQRLAAFA